MPSRYTKQNELEQFQYEVANEIKRDAPHIAEGVFGNNARHPDMATISNAEVDQMYRDAYQRQDRTFLMQEAQRDPNQFLAVTDRLGIEDPPMDPHGKPIPASADANALADQLQQQAAQNVVQAQPATVPSPPLVAPAALPPPSVPQQMPLPGMLTPPPVGSV